MANLTQPTDGDVGEYLRSVANEKRRADAIEFCALVTAVTGEQPVMWGTGIVGFGQQHLVYDSGRELDFLVLGFSARAAALTIYGIAPETPGVDQIGPITTGKGCLYVKDLSKLDRAAVERLVGDVWGSAR